MTTQRPIRTHISIEPQDDGWVATEPAADGDTTGHGPTPPDAVIDYARQVRDGRDG